MDVRPSALSVESQDWSKLRKAQPAEHLLPRSKNLLEQLPPEIFPGALARHYARIVNLIAFHWNDRNDCAEYFKELLTDRRGGRQGLAPAVRRDLVRLWAYCQRIGPQPELSGWRAASDARLAPRLVSSGFAPAAVVVHTVGQ